MRHRTVCPTENVLVGEHAAFTASVSPEVVAVSILIVKSLDIPADAGGAVVVVVGATVVVVVARVVVVTGATVVVVTGVRLATRVIVSWLTKPPCADAVLTPSAANPATPKPSATEPTPTFFMKSFIFCSFLLTG
jgi:hypothetical protein